MTAKEYLSQAWKTMMRVESMTEMLAVLKSAAEYPPACAPDMPKSTTRNIHKNEDAIIRVLDLEERIRAERVKLDGIIAVIANISDPTTQAIIVKRYIDRKTWNEIAEEIYISLRQVHRFHQCILDEMDHRLKVGTL